MKLFISHAVVDATLANHLVELLQVGAGVAHGDIFFSSMRGAIPNGAFFVERILTHLNASELVISLISRGYFKSQFCLQELGAAQALSFAKQAHIFSAIVPPVVYGDLNAMMMGVQSGPILSPDTLNELRDVVTSDMTTKPSITTWNAKRDEFTAKAAPIVQRGIAIERLNDFRVIDVNFTHDPNVTWKLKLNVDFRNETGIPIDGNQPTWAMSIGGLPQKDKWSGIQLRQPDGTWGAHAPAAHIANGGEFRVSIALDPSHSLESLRCRHENLNIGTMIVPLNIAGHNVELKRQV